MKHNDVDCEYRLIETEKVHEPATDRDRLSGNYIVGFDVWPEISPIQAPRAQRQTQQAKQGEQRLQAELKSAAHFSPKWFHERYYIEVERRAATIPDFKADFMIETPIQLCPASVPERTTAAWFISGEDPHVWLEELAGWRMPLAGVRLYLVPRSIADRRACGVLVVPPAGTAPESIVRAEPYGKAAPRLYVPAAGRLDPPAHSTELDSALTGDSAVWHPTAGLVSFDECDALSVADLLTAPAERPGSWNAARPGTAAPPRLVSVAPAAPPDWQESLDEWRDDIGSETEGELPPAPGEPSDAPLARVARWAQLAVARLASKLTSLVPRSATAATWLNQVENWACRQIANLGNRFDAARRKEINRLLHMLEHDPDRGLRHALPLGGAEHRGVGPPGYRLPARDLNFRLGRLGGGRPADPWQVDIEQQIALSRRYRELANREMELGRHRRAAYIFAELLGDEAAAASALEAGGHCREAAVLYRDRLRRPLDAARCLERCGGSEEALTIYIENDEFEKAAELLTRLERTDDASAMYRRAVDRWIEHGDRVRAAKLLEAKLSATDDAIEVLAAAWPSSTQATACLTELFNLLGRHARHEEMGRWIHRLRDERHSPAHLGRAVDLLAGVVQRYPDPAARHAAADATRVLVGRRLPAAVGAEATSLVRAVRSLVPQDELLGRDAARWLSRSPPAPRPVHRVPAPSKLTVTEIGRVRLPPDIAYKAVIATNAGLVAAGFTPRGVAAVSASLSGQIERVDWDAPLADLRPLVLAADVGPVMMIALVGGAALEQRFLRYNRPVGDLLARIGTPAWWTPDSLAMAASSLGVWWSIDNQLLLSALRVDGPQFSSQQFSLAELGVRAEPRDESPERLAVMLARREDVYLGMGHTLVMVKSDRVEQTQLKGWVRQIAAAPLVLQHRLAIGFEDDGAAVVWDDFNGRDVMDAAWNLQRPELAFTLDGLLVAADTREGHLYSTSNRRVALCGRFDGPRRPLAGLVAGERPGEFALLTEDGELRAYRIA